MRDWKVYISHINSYKLCFYHYQKLHHRTPFTTARRDQGSTVIVLGPIEAPPGYEVPLAYQRQQSFTLFSL